MTRLVNKRRLPLAAIVIGAAACAWLAACTNDPFDPDQLPNQAPTVRFFVEPVDADQNLNPTSYFSRTFHWSGSDADGQVAEYHVSIRPDAGVEAPWDTTSRTDTTMTFTTDDEGLAQATQEPVQYANLAIRGRKRGPIVDQQALTTVLQAGGIAGAGLDVLEHSRSRSLLGNRDVWLGYILQADK